MRQLLTILAIIAFLISSTTSTHAGYSNVVRSVRPLQTYLEDYWGGEVELHNICTTTSINSDKGYWLTANHCLSFGDVYIDNEMANIIMQDNDSDLAVLQTKHKVRSLKMQTSWPKVGQKISIVGHPLGIDEVQVFNGEISSLKVNVKGFGYKMHFNMLACGGNSGSAVINKNDEILSVLQIGYGKPCSAFSGGAIWPDMIRLVYKYFKK